MLFDAHVNIHHESFMKKHNDLIKNAQCYKVNKILCICDNIFHAGEIYSIIKNLKNVFMTIGHHPCSSGKISYEIFHEVYEKYKDKIVAIGETGIDLLKSNITFKEQIDLFDQHYQFAIKKKKPIIVHARNCENEIYHFFHQRISEIKKNNIHILMHCYNLSYDLAIKMISWKFFFSFTGIITFNNYNGQNIIRTIPQELLIIETDAPYLTPMPYRGFINEPMFLPIIAYEMSRIRSVSLKTLTKKLWYNTHKLLHLPY